MKIKVRQEQQADIPFITVLTQAAFAPIEYSSHTEHLIVNALRERQQLSISLVAEDETGIIGHVAVSPVRLSTAQQGWYGLGPISVLSNRQGEGIGRALMYEALAHLKVLAAQGCVLLGDPQYYRAFGFKTYANLVLADVPPEYFQAIVFTGEVPHAEVFYDDAFGITEEK